VLGAYLLPLTSSLLPQTHLGLWKVIGNKYCGFAAFMINCCQQRW